MVVVGGQGHALPFMHMVFCTQTSLSSQRLHPFISLPPCSPKKAHALSPAPHQVEDDPDDPVDGVVELRRDEFTSEKFWVLALHVNEPCQLCFNMEYVKYPVLLVVILASSSGGRFPVKSNLRSWARRSPKPNPESSPGRQSMNGTVTTECPSQRQRALRQPVPPRLPIKVGHARRWLHLPMACIALPPNGQLSTSLNGNRRVPSGLTSLGDSFTASHWSGTLGCASPVVNSAWLPSLT